MEIIGVAAIRAILCILSIIQVDDFIWLFYSNLNNFPITVEFPIILSVYMFPR